MTKKDHKDMVIPGVIVSVQNGVATVMCERQFFTECDTCSVAFPTADSYEEPQPVNCNLVDRRGDFVTFQLSPRDPNYVRSAKFEIRAPTSLDKVDLLWFLRKNYITPAGYTEGYIQYGPDARDEIEVVFQESPAPEYAYLGSPLFNRNGDVVGISYADAGPFIAYNVYHIGNAVLKSLHGVTYVLDGHLTDPYAGR